MVIRDYLYSNYMCFGHSFYLAFSFFSILNSIHICSALEEYKLLRLYFIRWARQIVLFILYWKEFSPQSVPFHFMRKSKENIIHFNSAFSLFFYTLSFGIWSFIDPCEAWLLVSVFFSVFFTATLLFQKSNYFSTDTWNIGSFFKYIYIFLLNTKIVDILGTQVHTRTHTHILYESCFHRHRIDRIYVCM